MKTLLGRFAILFSLSCCFACFKADRSAPVVVHVFRDPSATELNAAIREIGRSGLETARGRPIIIATEEPKTYQEGLEKLGKYLHPDLVVLNSPDDAKVLAGRRWLQLSSSAREYFAGVPGWTRGEERAAANEVLSRLQAILQSTVH